MRKGLFLSRGHGRISDVVDITGLAQDYEELPVVRVYDQLFGQSEQADMLELVRQHQLEGIVLAGPSPACFETGAEGAALISALKHQGLNQNRIAFANLDHQVAMIHPHADGGASIKARRLIDSALAKIACCHDVQTVVVEPQKAVLVVGASTAAVAAVIELLNRKYHVFLVEKNTTWNLSGDLADKANDRIAQIEAHTKLTRCFETNVIDVAGWCGDYTIELMDKHRRHKIVVGGILLCLGDDTEWIEQLRPKMHLDTDVRGMLTEPAGATSAGQTKDCGVWFVPHPESEDQFKAKANEARTVAGRLAAILDATRIEHPVLVSEVDPALCGGCGTCVKTCAFSASGVDPVQRISVIDVKKCAGCGNCVTSCPTGARDLITSPAAYVNQAVDIMSQGAEALGEPKILAILCKNSGYPALDAAGEPANHLPDGNYSVNVMPLRIECGGNVDTLYVLRALQRGCDGVALVTCKDGHCHYMVGNTDMERRLGLFRAVLRARNIDDNRMRIIHVSCHDGRRINEELKAFSEELKQMRLHN